MKEDFLKMQWTQEQSAILSTWKQGQVILAGAGCGKTTTLVEKCKLLFQKKKDARICAVSFTERSALDLRRKLSSFFPLSQNQTVTTIHGFCRKVLKDFPQQGALTGQEQVLSEADAEALWESVFEKMWSAPMDSDLTRDWDFVLDTFTPYQFHQLLNHLRKLFHFYPVLNAGKNPLLKALLRLGNALLKRFQLEKKQQGVLDFDDLEEKALLILKNRSVSSWYRKCFDLFLVDEFQDTNWIQAQILERVVRKDFSNLCIVGDPKQSIYGFRHADLNVFYEFISKIKVHQVLSVNFRSTAEILLFMNEACEPIFQGEQVPYHALVCGKDVEKKVQYLEMGKDVGSTSKEQVGQKGSEEKESREGTESVFSEEENGLSIFKEANPDRLVSFLTQAFQEWKNKKGKKNRKDLVFLFRNLRGNEKWFEALQKGGIPYRFGSGGFFWKDPRVGELVAFLKWWSQPSEMISALSFLRAPWVGISDVKIADWHEKEKREEGSVLESFLKEDHPLSKVLSSFIQKIIDPGSLLLSLLEVPKVEQSIGIIILELWRHVEQWSGQGKSFLEVVRVLDQNMVHQRRAVALPAPATEDQEVLIMTVHGAKGLEFDHVWVFCEKDPVVQDPLIFCDRNGVLFLPERNQKGQKDKKDPKYLKFRASLLEKEFEEMKRLFYVAGTRAKKTLSFVLPEIKKGKKKSSWAKWVAQAGERWVQKKKTHSALERDQVGEVSVADPWDRLRVVDLSAMEMPSLEKKKDGDVFCKRNPKEAWAEKEKLCVKESLWIKPSSLSVSVASNDSLVSNASWVSHVFTLKNRMSRRRHAVTEWCVFQRCPKRYAWKYIEHRFEPVEDLSQQLGTQVHQCLENPTWEGCLALEEKWGKEKFSAKTLWNWVQESEWMQPGLGKEHGVWTELAFEMPFEGALLVGAMDRVVWNVDEQGNQSVVLLDFKIHGGPKQEGIGGSSQEKNALEERYGFQMAVYLWVLEKLMKSKKKACASEPMVSFQTYLVRIFQNQVVPFSMTVPHWIQEKKPTVLETLLEAIWDVFKKTERGEKISGSYGSHCFYCGYQRSCEEFLRFKKTRKNEENHF